MIITEKKALRMKASRIRNQINDNDRVYSSRKIFERLMESEKFIKASKIYVYVSYKSEVDTVSFIESIFLKSDIHKEIFVPKVEGREMNFYKIISIDELEPSNMGILEPSGRKDRLDIAKDGIMIMPGLAFDTELNRIGYGGGFYDRYLSEHDTNDLYKVAVAFEEQIYEHIVSDENDIKPDIVITPERIIGKTDAI